ncbi:MAG: hypothetical protein ACJ72W_19185 [Actinoallomurus sp.]
MRRTLIICTVAGILASATACGGSGSKNDAKSESPAAGPAETAAGAPAQKSEAPTTKPGSGGHTVVLEVLGSGELPGIFYNTKTNGSVSNVKLPWKKTDQVPGGHLLAVLASSTSQKVTCTITVDGAVVAKQTGEVAQCRYTLKK